MKSILIWKELNLNNEAGLWRYFNVLRSEHGQITTKWKFISLIFRYMMMHGDKKRNMFAVSNEVFSCYLNDHLLP